MSTLSFLSDLFRQRGQQQQTYREMLAAGKTDVARMRVLLDIQERTQQSALYTNEFSYKQNIEKLIALVNELVGDANTVPDAWIHEYVQRSQTMHKILKIALEKYAVVQAREKSEREAYLKDTLDGVRHHLAKLLSIEQLIEALESTQITEARERMRALESSVYLFKQLLQKTQREGVVTTISVEGCAGAMHEELTRAKEHVTIMPPRFQKRYLTELSYAAQSLPRVGITHEEEMQTAYDQYDAFIQELLAVDKALLLQEQETLLEQQRLLAEQNVERVA